VDAIPEGERDVSGRYGFGPDMIYWQAVTSPAGYRLHLTGIQIMLARTLGVNATELDMAAQLLAGRQPENPFYLYLHLGTDQRVFEVAKAKCDEAANQSKLSDWAWQNAEPDKKWASAMLWDCAFIYSLLAH